MEVNNKKEYRKALIKSLTRTEKMVVVLFYYEEKTVPEIVRVLELSTSTVSKMHSSIISRCKSYLKNCDLN